MKTTLILLLGLLGSLQVTAQEYIPFTKVGSWTISCGENDFGVQPYRYYYDHIYIANNHDTLIAGKTYQKISQFSNTIKSGYFDGKYQNISWYGFENYRFLREENKRVYTYYEVDTIKKDFLLYDFNLKKGDTIAILSSFLRIPGAVTYFKFKVVGIDTVTYYYEKDKQKRRKRLSFKSNDYASPPFMEWVEGIGSNFGPFYAIDGVQGLEYGCGLGCFSEDTLGCRPYTGISNMKASPMGVSPNPLTSISSIQLDKNIQSGELEVFNAYGQQVKQASFKGRAYLHKEDYKVGIYFFRISTHGKLVGNGKFLVK